PLEPIKFSLTEREFDFTEEQLKVYKEKSAIETFRFIDLQDFSAEKVTLPIDKIVAALINEYSLKNNLLQ
ncbi:MAG TPA: hypothetical protein VLI68_04330, partial [Hanamia sp.]|nr:hypothetical protein [Hanamia sp.]